MILPNAVLRGCVPTFSRGGATRSFLRRRTVALHYLQYHLCRSLHVYGSISRLQISWRGRHGPWTSMVVALALRHVQRAGDKAITRRKLRVHVTFSIAFCYGIRLGISSLITRAISSAVSDVKMHRRGCSSELAAGENLQRSKHLRC
jgi:hypothetical protein